jgi:hypothetical protein
MNRRIKFAVLALVAMAAIGAVSAAAAQAGEFRAEKYPATVIGGQKTEHVFKFNAFSITCKVATFHGELPEASAELTLTAVYGECKTNNGKAAEVSMTSCDYRLHAGETLGGGKVDGSLDIECAEEGDGIDLVVPSNECKVQIPAQGNLNSLVYTDHPMLKDFDLDLGLVEIKYKQNANCPGGEMVLANGQYTGQSTMFANAEGAFDPLAVE